MKLSAAGRVALKRELRQHPNITKYVSSVAKVDRLSKQRMLFIARELEIDVDAIVQQAGHQIKEPARRFWEDSRYLWSDQHPGFSGTLDFDLAIKILGQEIVRKARVAYSYTPEWTYFDLVAERIMEGWFSSSIGMEVLALCEEDVVEDEKIVRKYHPIWTKSDLVEDGILPSAIWDAIEAQIDQKCRDEDDRRRSERNIPNDPSDLSGHEKMGLGLSDKREVLHRRRPSP